MCHLCIRLTGQASFWTRVSAPFCESGAFCLLPFVEHCIDDAIGFCFIGPHEIIAFGVLFDLLDTLARVLCNDLVQPLPRLQYLACMYVHIRRLSLEATERLVDEDP